MSLKLSNGKEVLPRQTWGNYSVSMVINNVFVGQTEDGDYTTMMNVDVAFVEGGMWSDVLITDKEFDELGLEKMGDSEEVFPVFNRLH